MSLIEELKRRNVLRASALYIGASWALTPAALISAENLRMDPIWDAIREDPGFQAILTRTMSQ